MGIIWKITMPLLSTLAALVIIVHSAEEDLDPDYRYDLRPRALDTGTPSYDPPWRVVQPEPIMHQSTPTDWEIGTSDESPKRRRPGRKRKRRPIETSTEELIQQDKYTYPDEPSPSNLELEYTQESSDEPPRRRRKKANARINRWADESVDNEKPIRRRGLRRKRPNLDAWPELSEFSGYRKVELSAETEQPFDRDLQVESNMYKTKDRQGLLLTNSRIETSSERRDDETNFDVMNSDSDDDHDRVIKADADNKMKKVIMIEDKSLSEFSAETLSEEKPKVEDRGHIQTKLKDKSPSYKNELNNAQDNGPIDPLTLKEILKRSNGTSLSEILQQHNLSLADLLHGKENVISILNKKELESSSETKHSLPPDDLVVNLSLINNETEANVQPTSTDRPEYENETVYVATGNTTDKTEIVQETEIKTSEQPEQQTVTEANLKTRQNRTRFINRRRYPLGMRKKLRMRPLANNTFKGQLSRDMMALNARRYYYKRNDTKSQHWKDIIPLVKNVSVDNETDDNKETTETTTMLTTIDDVTTMTETETYPSTISEDINTDNSSNNIEILNTTVTEATITTTIALETTATVTEIITTEKPIVTPIVQLLNASTIRRQAYNNRMKKKRLKLKQSTTELPRDNTIKSIPSPSIIVSPSEFVAKPTPKLTTIDENQEFTALEDFMTTETSKYIASSTAYAKTSSSRPSTFRHPIWSTTEETAKIEIEEILNDTRTSARLSKILMERNMTLNELVEHRERGSSHVHLADIFHNASREPNPPEPFLSKSLIEPISKETYPLRALLEANLHDPVAKTTTEEPLILHKKYMNIPVVMDFGNNVNENAENMGIMSLFNNFTNSDTSTNKVLQKDSQGTLYESSITSVNSTNMNDGSDREGRLLKDNQDLMNWKEIFAMIRKINNNETGKVDDQAEEQSPSQMYKKNIVHEDIDGDGLIVLEDLQRLRDFDSHKAPEHSREKLEVNSYERTDVPPKSGILSKIPNNTKSVTVATASIVGLATILFLLTYAAFKWRQQKNNQKKRSFCDGRIPSPVFESRKSNKNNSSSRSISPMLSSNIYTMNTIDSHHGKDSPEYMWDTLRKPFQ